MSIRGPTRSLRGNDNSLASNPGLELPVCKPHLGAFCAIDSTTSLTLLRECMSLTNAENSV